jgi:hypothetical protein
LEDDKVRTLVLDYLGQEGFCDIRDQLLDLVSSSTSAAKVQSKSSTKERKQNVEPKSLKKSGKTISLDCDLLVFDYLNSLPEYLEVARDFEAFRGPFVCNDRTLSSEKQIEKKKNELTEPNNNCETLKVKKKKKLTQIDNDCETPKEKKKKKKLAQPDNDCEILKVKKKKKKSTHPDDDSEILEVRKKKIKFSQPDNDCEILKVKKKKRRQKSTQPCDGCKNLKLRKKKLLPIESVNQTDKIVLDVRTVERSSALVMPIFKRGSLEKDLVYIFKKI